MSIPLGIFLTDICYQMPRPEVVLPQSYITPFFLHGNILTYMISSIQHCPNGPEHRFLTTLPSTFPVCVLAYSSWVVIEGFSNIFNKWSRMEITFWVVSYIALNVFYSNSKPTESHWICPTSIRERLNHKQG